MSARTFHLRRTEDATGVSGTGRVAEGIQFSDGKCALSWLTETSSVGVYESIEDVEKIHGHGGATRVVWDDVESKLSGLRAEIQSYERDYGDPRGPGGPPSGMSPALRREMELHELRQRNQGIRYQ